MFKNLTKQEAYEVTLRNRTLTCNKKIYETIRNWRYKISYLVLKKSKDVEAYSKHFVSLSSYTVKIGPSKIVLLMLSYS